METPVDGAVVAHERGWFSRTRAFLLRCWRGKAACSDAFWLLLVSGTVAFYIANILVVLLLAMLAAGLKAVSPDTADAGPVAVGVWVFAFGIAQIAFYVLALVSVWRCAPNTEHKVLAVLARVVVVVVAVLILIGLLSGDFRGQELVEQRRAGAGARADSGVICVNDEGRAIRTWCRSSA